WIDSLESELPPLRRFILAGGSPAGAALHVARTICRRAERAIVGLGPDAVEPELLTYVNRLSDLLFVMARSANHRAGSPEVEWGATSSRLLTRTASGWRASTTRTSPWPPTCCRQRCVRTSRPSTRLRGRPTTSPTMPGFQTPSDWRSWTNGARG